MLVLTRSIGEHVKLTVGDVEITVKVHDIQGKKMRLAFDAPMDKVRIVRGELVTERKAVEGLPPSPLPLIKIGDVLKGQE